MSTVAVTIDYSNGAHKHFSSIPSKKGLTILGAIQASEEIVPGATISFGSDRVGHVLKLVIDGCPREDEPASEWVVWVNAKPFQVVSARKRVSASSRMSARSTCSNREITS